MLRTGLKTLVAAGLTGLRKEAIRDWDQLEAVHRNNNEPNYNESIYFAALEPDGVSVVTRMSFRADKYDENWLKVHIPGHGVWGFEDREMPRGDGFSQGELVYRCVSAGKQWELFYDGPVAQEGRQETLKMRLKWYGASDIADFSRVGTHRIRVARRIARQPWSREFFQKLKGLSGVHYEQGGVMRGEVTFKGKTYPVQGTGVRDHSYGYRDWSDFNRHMWLVGVLEDGRFFNISIADYRFISDLRAGFIQDDGGGFKTLFSTPGFEDLDLSDKLPTQLYFFVRERPWQPRVPISVDMQTLFWFNMDRGIYRIREAKAVFHFGNVKGIGIAEMGISKELL